VKYKFNIYFTTRKGNWLIFQYLFGRVFVKDGDITRLILWLIVELNKLFVFF